MSRQGEGRFPEAMSKHCCERVNSIGLGGGRGEVGVRLPPTLMLSGSVLLDI